MHKNKTPNHFGKFKSRINFVLEPNQAKTFRCMHYRNYTRKNNTYFIFIATEPPKNMKNMFMQLQEIALAYIF